MKSKLIKIGNSRGVRINSNIIKECGLDNNIEIKVVDKKIIIESAKEPRAGWSKSFRNMHENNDDTLLINSSNEFDEDWEW